VNLEFVDTNVLLYAYDTTAGRRHDAARQLVMRLGRSRSGALSVQVLQEFYVNAVRKIAKPLTTAAARGRVKAFALWPTHVPQTRDILAAIDLADSAQISFWDATILRSASEMGCTTLWTEDLNAGQVVAGVRIVDPFAQF